MGSFRDSKVTRASSKLLSGFSAVIVWLYALLLLVPLYFLIASAFKQNAVILEAPLALPTSFSFAKFSEAWNNANLGGALVSSGYVTLIALFLTVLLAVPAAFAISRSNGRMIRLIEQSFNIGFFIPGFAALVPTLWLAIALGMFHTREFLALFLPVTALPLAILLVAQYMRSIPLELEESAMMDGASRIRILVTIFVPLSWPAIASVLILNFIGFWNEYIFSLVLAGPDENIRTTQVALPTLTTAPAVTDFGLVSAGTVITLIPVMIFYILLQKRLVGAFTAGAVKG